MKPSKLSLVEGKQVIPWDKGQFGAMFKGKRKVVGLTMGKEQDNKVLIFKPSSVGMKNNLVHYKKVLFPRHCREICYEMGELGLGELYCNYNYMGSEITLII